MKLPLKLYWIRFSGFCTVLECWFLFLSHYYSLLQFSLPYFATLPNVAYLQSLRFLLPTGSTLLFSLFNSPCCSWVISANCWDHLNCSPVLCSVCCPSSAWYKQCSILSPKSFVKILIELNLEWIPTFHFKPFLSLTAKHW